MYLQKPVPSIKGREDFSVSEHLDQFCNTKTQIYTNKCTFGKCKTRELVPFACSVCKKNFCLSKILKNVRKLVKLNQKCFAEHRHFADHKCPLKSQNMTPRDTVAWVFQLLSIIQILILLDSQTSRTQTSWWKQPRKCEEGSRKFFRRWSFSTSPGSVDESAAKSNLCWWLLKSRQKMFSIIKTLQILFQSETIHIVTIFFIPLKLNKTILWYFTKNWEIVWWHADKLVKLSRSWIFAVLRLGFSEDTLKLRTPWRHPEKHSREIKSVILLLCVQRAASERKTTK